MMLSLEKKTNVELIEEAACALVDKVEELTSVKMSPDFEAFRKTVVPTQAVQAAQGSAILWYVIQVSCLNCGVFKGLDIYFKAISFTHVV